MAYSGAHRHNNYMGEFSNGTNATAGIIAMELDNGGNIYAGMFYYDTTDNDFKVWNGTSWAAPGAGGLAHNDLSGKQGGTTDEYYHLTSAQHTEITTFFGNTDLTGAEAETLSDGSDASSLHIHDGRYYTESEHISTSAGAGDAGKPIVLDAAGHIDASMLNDADIDHGSIGGLSDDDHTQYILVSGTRAFTGTVTGVTPTASGHLATKGYVDALFTNFKAKGGVLVLNMISNGNSGPPLSPSDGDAYIVDSATGDWSGFDVGDTVVYNGGWLLVLADDGGAVPTGARYIITGIDGSGASGSFSGHDKEIAEWNGSGWDFSGAPADGWYVVIHGENDPAENSGYVVDSGSWVQWTGNTQSHNSLTSLQGGTTNEYYHLTSAQHTEITTFFGNTDLTGAEAETLSDGSDASSLHIHDSRYYTESEHINASTGVPDAGKPIKLTANGLIDGSMLDHLDMGNLQGGTTDEYYHLTSAQHTEVTTFFGNTDLTGAEAETLSDGSDASSLHIHDGRYYTETELGGTTGGSEGAALIGTDTKANLNNATTVEVALTELNTRNSGANKSYEGNPNGNVAGAAGDFCRDTSNGFLYWCATGGDAAGAVWYIS